MSDVALNRVRTAALHRGGSNAQRDQMLGNAIAHAMSNGCAMDQIMKAAKIKDVHKVVDLAAIGGFIATCTSADFRDAAEIIHSVTVRGGGGSYSHTVHDQAVGARIKTMLKKMADHYDATVALNAHKAQERM